MSEHRFRSRSRRPGAEGRPVLPPALARLPVGPSRMPREFIEQHQRDRILLAALEVFGTKGAAAATVQELVVEAAVSRETFYRLFANLEACLLALLGEVLDWLEQELREEARAAEDWPLAVRRVSGRLIGLLLEDRRLARLVAVEGLLGSPSVRARHEAALGDLVSALALGREERPWGPELPRDLERLILLGALSVIGRVIARGSDAEAEALLDEVPEILLIPYLGLADARRVIAGR